MRKRLLQAGLLLGMALLSLTYIKSTGELLEPIPEANKKPVESELQDDNKIIGDNHANENHVVSVDSLERTLESNLINGFQYGKADHAIYSFEQYINESFEAYVFEVYAEKENKDICYEGSICILEQSGDIFVKEKEWFIISEEGYERYNGKGDAYTFTEQSLSDIALLEACSRGNLSERKIKNIDNQEKYEIMEQAADYFMKKNYPDLKIMYSGSYSYLGREYYRIDTFLTDGMDSGVFCQYYIDSKTKDLYEKPEESYRYVKASLYYSGNLGDV